MLIVDEAYPSHFMYELKELVYSDEKEHWATIHIVSVACSTNNYVDITTFFMVVVILVAFLYIACTVIFTM